MKNMKYKSTIVTWWKSKKCKRKMDCQRQKRLLASRRATDTSLRDGWQPAQFYELESCALLLACAVCSVWGFDYMQTKFTHSVFCASFSCILYSVSVYSGSAKETQRTWEVEVSLAQTTLPPPSLLPLFQVRVFRQFFVFVFYAYCLQCVFICLLCAIPSILTSWIVVSVCADMCLISTPPPHCILRSALSPIYCPFLGCHYYNNVRHSYARNNQHDADKGK